MAETKLLQFSPVDLELTQRTYWLIQLRWIAASAVIYGAFVFTYIFNLRIAALPLYLIGGAIAVYNSLFIILLKWSEVNRGREHVNRARLTTHAQIVVDLFFLTLLIHYTGGIENPLSFFFVFHVIISSILLSRRETFLQVTVGNFFYGTLVLGEFTRLLPHVYLFGPALPDHSRDPLFVTTVLLAFSSTLYLAAYMATSITSRLRQREREIIELTGELEDKAEELQAACERLTELEQIKSAHLGSVSGQIKEPLSALQSYLSMLLDGVSGELQPNQREMVAKAARRAQNAQHIVSDLAVLSRAAEVKRFLGRKPVRLVLVIARVLSAQDPRITAKSLVLSSSIGEVPPVLGDPEALEQMVANLVSNAITYTLNGGKIHVVLDSIGEMVRLRVSDTGIGIPTTDHERIFNEFFRSENARRFNESGTGLGLTISRSVAESHGGRIGVESQVGVGTTFTVLLPGAPQQRDWDLRDSTGEQEN